MPVDTRTWRGRDGVALCIVVVVAAALRFAGVTSPNTLYFDEYHYARQACFLAWDTSACGFEETRRPVHPPLARRLIALGIRALGNNPLGWRVAPALAGTLSVVLLYLLARRLLGSTAAAVTASGLLAVDALHFIHSRLAMLDIFVALFVLAAALFCAYDRGQVLSGRPHASPAWFSSLLGHRWRVAAGAAVGAAAACKWPGAFVLLAIVPLTLGWELATRRDRGLKAALVGVFREESVSFIVSFMLVPALAYAAAHVGTVRGVLLAWPWSEGSWLRAFVDEQVFFYRYHVSLTRLHRYHAPPWLWFSPLRGVVYYSQASDAGYRIVAGIGNPFALWFSLLAISYLAVSVVARGRSTTSADAFIVAGFLATYGPWFLLSGDRLPFAFYLLPSIPFMELALASVVVAVARRPVVRVLVPLWATFTLGFFISVYPWYTAIREPDWWWVHLSPRAFDCDWLRFTVPAPSATHLRC